MEYSVQPITYRVTVPWIAHVFLARGPFQTIVNQSLLLLAALPAIIVRPDLADIDCPRPVRTEADSTTATVVWPHHRHGRLQRSMLLESNHGSLPGNSGASTALVALRDC